MSRSTALGSSNLQASFLTGLIEQTHRPRVSGPILPAAYGDSAAALTTFFLICGGPQITTFSVACRAPDGTVSGDTVGRA